MVSFYIKVNPDSPDEETIEVNKGDLIQIGRKPAPEGVRKVILAGSGVSGLHGHRVRFNPAISSFEGAGTLESATR